MSDARATRFAAAKSFLAGRTFIIFTRSAAFRERARAASHGETLCGRRSGTYLDVASRPDNRECYDIAHCDIPTLLFGRETSDRSSAIDYANEVRPWFGVSPMIRT